MSIYETKVEEICSYKNDKYYCLSFTQSKLNYLKTSLVITNPE